MFTLIIQSLTTKPDQGQGGAQSLEDAAALGALFTSETTPEQVPDRLQLYNQVRYGHAVTVMMMSKLPDNRRAEMLDELRSYVPTAELPKDMYSLRGIRIQLERLSGP